MTKHDERCKGIKTDKELFEEYKELNDRYELTTTDKARVKAIKKLLGDKFDLCEELDNLRCSITSIKEDMKIVKDKKPNWFHYW